MGDSTSAGEVQVRVGAQATSMAVHDAETRAREENSRLPFTRMDLAFIDLRDVVTVTEQDDVGVKRTFEPALLQRISKSGEPSRAVSALLLSIHHESLRGLITPLVSAPHLADNDHLGMQTRPKLKQLSSLSFSCSCHLLRQLTSSKGRFYF